MKPLFWFSRYLLQRPEVKIPGSSHLQIRAAKTKDLSCLAEILADSFHSRVGFSGWFYPLFRLGIYEDLRHRLQANSPRYICLVGAYSPTSSISATQPSSHVSGEGVRTDAFIHGERQARNFLHQESESNEASLFASEQRDYLAGTVEMTLRSTNPWSLYSSSQYPYVSNLAVRAECRRQGVARQLLLSCERIALEWGFRDIYLHVLENNDKARRLYHKLGYRLHQVDSSWTCLLLGQPRRLLLHKRLTSS